MSLAGRLVRCWYGRRGWCQALLPISLLFFLLAALRRAWYGLRPARRLPVPVIVVGNLAVGGTGKTPLVIWLVERLRAAGHRPGVISRGYGAAAAAPMAVWPASDPAQAGDEPVLLARRARCPVWTARRRAEAGRALLAAHPEVDVIVADDGLQHYALARDLEVVVVDGRRGFGNGLLLPAGPLREARSRLASVDAVVVNGGAALDGLAAPVYAMQLRGGPIHNLARPEWRVDAGHFRGRPVQAVAAIGNPDRFFDALAGLGLAVAPCAFPDHHPFRPGDLPAGPVIMTEKDAVKCAAFGRDDIWVWPVDAEVSEGLEKQVLAKLDALHG